MDPLRVQNGLFGTVANFLTHRNYISWSVGGLWMRLIAILISYMYLVIEIPVFFVEIWLMYLVPFCHLQGYTKYALNCFLSVSESKGIKASILILKVRSWVLISKPFRFFTSRYYWLSYCWHYNKTVCHINFKKEDYQRK